MSRFVILDRQRALNPWSLCMMYVMMGFVDINTLPSDQPLHQVQNASLPPAFVRAYEQISLDVGVGGHGLRKWAHHADAAYVGQWALTVQSATEVSGECHYPVLNQVVEEAAKADQYTDSMVIVSDLRGAWDRCVVTSQRAIGFGLKSHNSKVAALGDWLERTDADVGRIIEMPDKAQREISASVVALEVYDFKCTLNASEDWDSVRRKVNYQACSGPQAGRWTQVVPWDRHGHLNMTNTAYLVAFCRRYRLERPRRLRGRRLEEAEGFAMGFDGDYDECDDPKRQWAKSLVHHTIVDALTRFLKDCGMVEVKKEYKYWDPARVGKDGSRRVPDVTCVNPNTGTEYVLDARIYWNSMSNGPTGYTAYRHEGWGAEHGEAEKNSSWGEAIARRQEESVHNVKFVPFSLEAGGVWGPAAKKFFKQCASQADNQDRDVDLYHWSSAKFESTWRDTISVLVARGRAQVGVHSAKSDWSRRILDFAYMDYDDQAAHHE